ncbi:CPBP family intramembrane glutamic endopeptidase [Nonomuraea rubra]|uniref:Membrane protease YdiL (CAAX protease family) n=1 Tax=Nonomuraea rubra TaxID=46180 RepID=A0A7X0U1A8_9ACTN|nr:CPBP family intramembrane glutamic endopeptidase [Nonomuraea rubra]MBB6551234.1 membrane protease YdiL (CAAX protease family) [Nonomuraea rubra]
MVFLLGAFGLSWLFIVPLWLGDGIASPLLQPLAAAMMFTPTLGVLAVWLRKRAAPAELVAQTGLGLGPSKTRTFGLAAVAWLSVPAFAALTLALGVVLGLVTLDLSGLSLYRDTMGVQGANLHAAWAGQVLTGLTLGTVVTMIPAFGEEWGWRGWLVPWLSAEAGVSRGLLISGLIWGLWHAPLTLLGYNYPNLGAWAALVFVGFCVTFGLVLGWLRLRTGSIWPAVVAHAAFNATVPTFLMLGDATTPPNFAIAGPIGLVGWAVLGLLAAALLKLLPVWRPAPIS